MKAHSLLFRIGKQLEGCIFRFVAFCDSRAETFSKRPLNLYKPVPRKQIVDALIHLRGLFREISPSSEKDYRARERREILTKNFLSNLFRTKDHPTLNAVLEVADVFSLTLDGAHRLFGYELEKIREYDLLLNAGRTHDEKCDIAVHTRVF